MMGMEILEIGRLNLFDPKGKAERRILNLASLSMNVIFLLPGQEIRTHTHEKEDNVFIILEGEAAVVCGGEERLVGVGQAAYTPAKHPHSVKVHGDRPLKIFGVLFKV